MRKKAAEHENSKSLKTFFLYFAIVLFVIIVSLGIKAFSIVQASKFDGEHQFVIAIGADDKAKQIVAFNPDSSTPLLEIKNANISLNSVGKRLGVPIDGKINVSSNFPWGQTISDTMTNIAWRYNMIKTDITLYDIIRVILLAKNPSNTSATETITFPQQEREINKMISDLFIDQTIASENTTMQIINATDTPGMGKRLERVLTNIGGNVISVTTQQKKEQKSQIRYYGESSYTLKRLEQLLHYPLLQVAKEPIADIVIIIGEDSVNTEKF